LTGKWLAHVARQTNGSKARFGELLILWKRRFCQFGCLLWDIVQVGVLNNGKLGAKSGCSRYVFSLTHSIA